VTAATTAAQVILVLQDKRVIQVCQAEMDQKEMPAPPDPPVETWCQADLLENVVHLVFLEILALLVTLDNLALPGNLDQWVLKVGKGFLVLQAVKVLLEKKVLREIRVCLVNPVQLESVASLACEDQRENQGQLVFLEQAFLDSLAILEHLVFPVLLDVKENLETLEQEDRLETLSMVFPEHLVHPDRKVTKVILLEMEPPDYLVYPAQKETRVAHAHPVGRVKKARKVNVETMVYPVQQEIEVCLAFEVKLDPMDHRDHKDLLE
jgi:hypothetical protein